MAPTFLSTRPADPVPDSQPPIRRARPIPGSPEWDDFMPIADSWKGRPLKDLPPDQPLSEDLLGLARFVVSCVGPEYPEYAEAKRRLALAEMSSGASSR